MHTLFEPNREAVTWRSADECVAMIDCYLTDDGKRKASKAGQDRTLSSHIFRRRVADILQFVTLRTSRAAVRRSCTRRGVAKGQRAAACL
ncbi:glycosyltransferase [Bradyrhizobium sp. GCM10028915]|uniref:glycosyltransferase family protein n=1 Tax=Bradyrhizobium sp. GCM10028915 TaxID=3273385 RepID=UPI0036201752